MSEAMATTEHGQEMMTHHRHTIEALFGGTLVSGLVAAGATALSIIALTGMFPMMLVSIAMIGIGAAFLFEGAAIVSRMSDLVHEVTEGRMQAAELGVGMTGETLAGLAGVALGVLSLFGIFPAILVPAAAIAFGAALVFGAGSNIRINHLTMLYRNEHPIAQRIAREAVYATTGLQVLAGLGAIALGVIALAGISPMILELVAMLVVSGAFLLSDTAVAGRMATIFNRR